ncbi:hypothetical protein HK101_001243 [Irineochytrium annulatum]|nr:hypothetical protein HK101_001243 [Irineochytrium annulatum]
MGVSGLSGCMREASKPAQSLASIKATPKALIIDANSLLHRCTRDIGLEASGNYRSLSSSVLRRCRSLSKDAGFNSILLVFDGPLPEYKAAQRIERELGKHARCFHQFTAMLHDEPVGMSGGGARNVKGKKGVRPTQDRFTGEVLLPPMAVQAVAAAIRKERSKCEVDVGMVGRQADQHVLPWIEVEVAGGEADQLISLRAREMGALVLSGDSDFYIADVPGFIHLDSVRFGDEHEQGNGKNRCADGSAGGVTGCVWTRDGVATHMGLRSAAVLPLLAAIAGCDYVDPESLSSLPQLSDLRRCTNAIARVRAVAALLRTYESSSAGIAALTGDADSIAAAALTRAVAAYDGTSSIGAVTLPASRYADRFRDGRHAHRLLEALGGTFWCQAVAEDQLRSSAWTSSRELRRWMYLFVQWAMRGDACAEGRTVEEYVRKGVDYRPDKVEPHTVVEAVALLTTAGEARRISRFADLMTNDRLTLYARCMGYDGDWTDLVRGLGPGIKTIPAALVILHTARSMRDAGRPLRNFEAVALLCVAVRGGFEADGSARNGLTRRSSSSRAAPAASRDAVHLAAQVKCALCSASLLLQSLWICDADGDAAAECNEDGACQTLSNLHWNWFDAGAVHTALTEARRGKGPEELGCDGDEAVAEFVRVWRFLMVDGGMEGLVERVLAYDFDVAEPTVMEDVAEVVERPKMEPPKDGDIGGEVDEIFRHVLDDGFQMVARGPGGPLRRQKGTWKKPEVPVGATYGFGRAGNAFSALADET